LPARIPYTRTMATDKPDIKPTRHQVQERFLCRLADIADGGSKEVALHEDSPFSLCLVRQKDTVYAYVNSCPHTGAPLNWGTDKFLNWDGALIQCSFHGAQFRIHDGLCVWGPCLHRRLAAVPVVVRDGEILLPDQDKIPAAR